MPISEELLASFDEDSVYHIICTSIEGKFLFLSDENKRYFLQRYQDYLLHFADTYAYCLLSNHVHWLIRTKSIKSILEYLHQLPDDKISPTQRKFVQHENKPMMFHELIEQQFNRFFISYALAFNKKEQKTGHLFHRPFKRISVKDNTYFSQLFIYIHANPLKHKLTADFTTWQWSSYQPLLNNVPTFLCRDEALDWFGGKEQFIKTHKTQSDYYYNHDLSGE